jgi:cysteine desulfurase family protein (TIGR01976 family)
VVTAARAAASDLLGAATDEVVFGPNMTTLNFALSRTAARDWRPGDEVVVTRLDHDGNVAPWLELAVDKGLTVHFCELDAECRIELDHLRSLLSERTRVVAFPWASNAVGTVTPVREIAALAHEAGALAWVDAVHYAPHGEIDVREVDVDVLVCSPYKFFGPHLGLAYGRRELLQRWRPYKVRPASDAPGPRHETGTLAHELLCGFVACVEYLHGVGWRFVAEREGALGQRFLDGLPDGWTLHGPQTMDDRVPTFAITNAAESPDAAAIRLAEQGFAVWSGDYYALEVMKHLGLDDGALRVGIVHYNTEDEVDRLLGALG